MKLSSSTGDERESRDLFGRLMAYKPEQLFKRCVIIVSARTNNERLVVSETKNKVKLGCCCAVRSCPDLVTNVGSACVPEWKPHLTGLLEVYVTNLLVPISCMTSLLNELTNNVTIKLCGDLILHFRAVYLPTN